MPANAATSSMPNWVPPAALAYLVHTETGQPIRALARALGCHASTVLRQIRRIEQRRDDPLVDSALRTLGAAHFQPRANADLLQKKDAVRMNSQPTPNPGPTDTPDESAILAQAGRILRRLCETGAVLAVATDMEKAVIVRDGPGGQTTRTGVVPRKIAEALALKDWISTDKVGRITRYKITSSGRAALETMLGHDTAETPGFADSMTPFADQHRSWGEKQLIEPETGRPRRMRYNLAESPLTALARRRDKNGAAFLTDDQVTAGERLREDFELAQMGPRVAQNWDRFLTAGGRGSFVPDSGVGDGPTKARARVAAALTDLGPGLSDVVLRCCCYLEGLERAEKKLGWSARSGKIVLRIALTRLHRHYAETTGPGGPLIG